MNRFLTTIRRAVAPLRHAPSVHERGIGQRPLITQRNFSVGKPLYFRLLQHDTMPLEFSIDPTYTLDEPPCLVHEWLATGRTTHTAIACIPEEDRYHIWLPTDQCGLQRIRIKARVQGQWYWDAMPATYYLVDPARIPDLRIYTFIPTANGHMGEWCHDLERVEQLGFNMIQLLPITMMDLSESPYAIHDHFAIDPAYIDPAGDPDPWKQFRQFVACATARHCALSLDLVFNHAGIKSPLVTAHPTWFVGDPTECDGLRRAGWHDGVTRHTWHDLALFDYDTPDRRERAALWAYMTDYGLFWSQFAAETGGMIRLDNLHASHEGFMEHILGTIRHRYPELIIFGELFASESETERLARKLGIHLFLATPWEHKFLPALRKYIQYLHAKSDTLRYYFPISSHDSGSPAQEFGDVSSTIPRLVISTLLGPGPSGVTQGVEFGLKERIDFIGRRPRLELTPHAEISTLLTTLNRLTASSPHFHMPGNIHFVDRNHDAIIAACRLNDERETAYLIAANLDIHHAQTLTVPLVDLPGHRPTWPLRNVINDTPFATADGSITLAMDPGGVLILHIGPV